MDKTRTVKKLQAYLQNPDLIKEPTLAELADLTVVVLGAVSRIESAIETKKLDIDAKFSKKSDEVLSTVVRDKEYHLKRLTDEVNNLLREADARLSDTATNLEANVLQALQNIRDGKDGIVTEQEIQRAAEVALSMIELPDFDALVTEQITSNGQAVRDALELLSGEERYKVEIADVQGLRDMLESLAQIRSVSGGTIGKQQVYGFIRQAISDGIITTGGVSTFLDLTDTPSSYSGQGGKLVAVKGAEDGVEFIAPPSGSGDVIGPASSTDNNIALFNGVTGKIIKDSGVTTAAFAAASHTHSLSAITDVTASAAEVNVLDGIPGTLTATELGYVDGVTSSIQTQLNGKAATSHTHAISDVTGLQTALDAKAPTADPTFTTKITTPVVRASTSAGLLIEANGGTDVADFGAGGGSNATFYGGVNIDGQTRLATSLTGVLRADSGVVSTDSDVTDLVSAASTTLAGKVELATDAETVTGTDTARATTPANITARLAAPGTIGGTTPGAATFTTVTTTGNIELGNASDTTLSRVSAGLIAVEGNEVVLANRAATRSMTLTAVGGRPTTTSGCASPTQIEAGTNDIDYFVLDFDATTQEYAFWNARLPDNYDGGTITARFKWTSAAGSAGGTVVWGIQALAIGNDDAIDAAYGAAQEVSDDWIANGDLHITAATSAITIAGTPQAGDMLMVRVYRDPADANDDLTGDARLMQVVLEYGINNYSE